MEIESGKRGCVGAPCWHCWSLYGERGSRGMRRSTHDHVMSKRHDFFAVTGLNNEIERLSPLCNTRLNDAIDPVRRHEPSGRTAAPHDESPAHFRRV